MPNCAVAECKNCNQNTKGGDENIKYFSFPKKQEFAKQWIAACQRGDKINLKNATVCSVHFEDKCFEIPLRQRLLNYTPKNARHLNFDAVPTLNLPGGPSVNAQKRKYDERLLEIAKRRRREEVEDIMSASTSSSTLEAHNTKTITEDSKLPVKEEQELNATLSNTERAQAELVELRQKMNILESENKNLLKQVEEAKSSASQKYNIILAKVFTPGQIKKLLSPNANRRVCWSTEDIASAISLQSVSPKTYRYLRANNYPLPSMSTLRSWTGKF